MGAPGYALLCSKGHLFYWIPEHLYWTDEMFEEKRKKEKEGCICGDKNIINISHYGDINDCICLESEIEEKGIKITSKIDEFLIPFEHAFDKEGKPLKDVYTKVSLPVYYIPDNVRDRSIWELPEKL